MLYWVFKLDYTRQNAAKSANSFVQANKLEFCAHRPTAVQNTTAFTEPIP